MEPVDKYITIQKKRVHCIAAGSSEKLGVIFLHGARFSAKDWLSTGSLTYLAREGYGAYALDLPGFGESERISLMPQHFVKAFIEEVGFRRFVLVGPSMGGKIALLCALEKIEGIVGMVLIAPDGLPSLKDRLKEIDIPVLLIWGDRDQVIPITDSEVLLMETKRTHIWILKGEGHAGYFNRSQEFNETLLDFLANIPDPADSCLT